MTNAELRVKLVPIEILYLTIVGEAMGEPIESQIACAYVIKNRLLSNPSKYKTYHDVCLAPKQFSCWNENDPNRLGLETLAEKIVRGKEPETIHLKQCMAVAKLVHNNEIKDNTRGAKHYMTSKLFYSTKRPDWAGVPSSDLITKGDHVFFNV